MPRCQHLPKATLLYTVYEEACRRCTTAGAAFSGPVQASGCSKNGYGLAVVNGNPEVAEYYNIVKADKDPLIEKRERPQTYCCTVLPSRDNKWRTDKRPTIECETTD